MNDHGISETWTYTRDAKPTVMGIVWLVCRRPYWKGQMETREKEIAKAAERYSDSSDGQGCFEAGAEWADANPAKPPMYITEGGLVVKAPMTYEEWRDMTATLLKFWDLSPESKEAVLLMIDGLKYRKSE